MVGLYPFDVEALLGERLASGVQHVLVGYAHEGPSGEVLGLGSASYKEQQDHRQS